MSTHIPVRGLIVTAIAFVIAAALFFFLNNSFGGPRIAPTPLYELHAHFDNTELLVKKSLVMTRGIQVGYVTGVEVEGDLANVSFTVWDDYRPVFRDATAQVGARTIFGEPYVELDSGHRGAGELTSGSEVRSLETVEPDEAIAVLNTSARKHLTAGMRELARGFRSPQAADQLGHTISGLNATIARLRQLTDAVKGQEDDIAGLVTSGRVAVGAAGDREESLREIVASGRTALEAIASEQAALEAGLDELPRLVTSAERTITNLRPLLVEARPVVADAVHAAPRLEPALKDLEPVAAELRAIGEQFPAVDRAGTPTLEDALPSLRNLLPLAKQLTPASRNAVPLAEWVGPRAGSLAAFMGNAASATQNGDSEGKWLRLFMFGDERQSSGARAEPCDSPDGACFNAYPKPKGAENLKPYKAGTYPRLKPFEP